MGDREDLSKRKGFSEYTTLIGRNLQYHGFMVTAYFQHIPEAARALGALLAQNKLSSKGSTLREGKRLEDWPEMLDEIMSGGGSVFGRVIMRLNAVTNTT